MSEATLKTYCWMYSTFNIPPAFQGNCARKRFSEDEMYNTYYQWVSLCLVGQVGPHTSVLQYSNVSTISLDYIPEQPVVVDVNRKIPVNSLVLFVSGLLLGMYWFCFLLFF